MLGIEEVSEIYGEIMKGEKHGLPPGFRFHPTDEELIAFYLASKVIEPGNNFGVKIAEVDLNRCEPWELPEEAKMGDREWYFFSLKMRKYPTGLRTNRATAAGYWKATGKDRQICSASNGAKLGTRKTLVFYKGGAPRGHKTNWVMHEYRLHSHFLPRFACKDEWVLCRIIEKNGEKMKSPSSFQETTRLFEKAAASPTPISLPPLPETTPATEVLESQSTDFHSHENDLQSLIMNVPHLAFQSTLFPLGLQMNPFPPSSPSLLINSLSSYRHFQPADGTAVELMKEIQNQNISTFGETSVFAATAIAVHAADDINSSSTAGNDSYCQILC